MMGKIHEWFLAHVQTHVTVMCAAAVMHIFHTMFHLTLTSLCKSAPMCADMQLHEDVIIDLV